MPTPDSENWVQLTLEDYVSEVPQQLLTPDEMYQALSKSNVKKWVENNRIEYKSARVDCAEIGNYCAMWANTPPAGGILVIGVENDGRVEGCLSVGQDKVNEIEKAPFSFCPDAQVTSKSVSILRESTGQPDFLLAFRVQYHPSRAIKNVKGQVFQRAGDTIRTLNDAQVRDLMHEKGEISFEKEFAKLAYPDDFRLDEIAKFCDAVRQAKSWTMPHSDLEILKLLKLGDLNSEGFRPYITCGLLFANDPRDVCPGGRVRFLRFEGTVEGTGSSWNAVRDEWIDGTVPELIVKTENVLKSQLRTFSRLDRSGRFESQPEYPTEAWYEAIVNAVAHRSYGNGLSNSHVTVKMFEDRLVIESPGPFMPFVNPSNIYDSQVSRNPFLMDALYYLRYVRAANEGTRRMRDLMQSMGLPAPEFIQEQVGGAKVRVTLKNSVNQRRVWVDSDIAELIGAQIAGTLSEDEKRVLNYVATNSTINVTQGLRYLGRNWNTVKKILDGLVRKNLLVHEHRFQGEPGTVDRQAHYRLR